MRNPELEGTALGRHPRAVRRATMNRMDKSLRAREIKLPRADRSVETFRLSEPKHFPDRQGSKLNRVAFAAAHVVADPKADNDPWLDCAIDWDKTIAFREHMWGRGLWHY